MSKFILDKWSPLLLSALRFVTGFLYIWHGTSKYFHYPMDMGHITPLSLFGLAGILEIVGGGLLILGLFTKPAAFILSGQMAVAYFMFHAPQGFMPLVNHGEDAVLFCFIFLYIAAAGAGPLSLDAMLRKR